MAASDQNTRRANEAERARHIAGSEAAAFATTAGTMLLGLLTGADAAQKGNEPQPPAATPPPPPASHPNEVAPTESTPADHPPIHDDRRADVIEEAPAADPTPIMHADTAAIVEAPQATALVDTAPDGQAVTTHSSAPSIPVSTFSAPTHHSPSPVESTGINDTTPPSIDPGGPVHQLSGAITGLVDTSLTSVTHTIASLGAAVGQLTSSLSGTVSDLVGGLTGLVTNLTDHTPATAVAEPQVANILGPTPAATESSDAIQPGASLLDTAGAVPTALLHPLPLHLGFLGQPTTDGHETHDGAFSALGVHHF